MHGTNPIGGSDAQHGAQSDIAAQISAFRTAAPNSWIFMIVPPGGYARTNLTAAVNAAIAAGDAKVILIDAGTAYQNGVSQPGTASDQAIDGLHPYAKVHAEFASKFAAQVQHTLEPRHFTFAAA